MKITEARFIKGITGTDDILYDGKPQIAFLGRSNSGKSTLINNLTGKSTLARTSSRPGQTIRMDFFLVNNRVYFVDFPGYGYARAGIDMREKLRKMILWYLMYSEVKKRAVILITDIRVGITDFDRDALSTLYEYGIPHIVIANKADKLTRNEQQNQIGVYKEAYPNSEIIPYSSKKNSGRGILLEKFNKFVV